MKMKWVGQKLAVLAAGIAAIGLVLLTHGVGRGNCPRCGHTRELHVCKQKNCGWTACLDCWQRLGKYACPGCGLAP